MYSVSDAYKVTVADSHRKSKMRAVLTVGKTVINLDDNDIIKDSVYITNQCTNGNEYEYGCVYAGECGITIKSSADRYSLYDSELKLFWSLWTGEAWEEIPLGVFYISEPNRINDKISIKALDGMIKLDVNVDEDTQGTMIELLHYISDKCGVSLSQTDEELGAFINSNVQYSVYADKVETHRDLLAYICMMSACFAVFDRQGKLKVVSYATEPCVTLSKKQRFAKATFSDYTTKFVGIKARFIAEENYAPYESGETGNGLILDMGDNPIVRGLPETKHALLDAVFEVLKNVSYTPFEIETLGNPAIDLGDMVKNIYVGKDGKTYLSPITYYYWTYRGKHKLRGVGGNPKLSGVKNKQGKQIGSLEGEIEAKNIIVKNYVNADAISFRESETEIATLNYAATENSKIIFLMTLRVEMSLDGVLLIKFYTDSSADESRVFRKYLDRGEHFLTISDVYTADTNERHTISIKACMEYYESDTRKQAADIQTYKNFLEAIASTGATVADNVVTFPTYEKGVIDTTIATTIIRAGGVKAMLYGQGVAADGKWDGTINFEDNVKIAFAGGISLAKLSDYMSESIRTPSPVGLSEILSSLNFGGGIALQNISDSVGIGKVVKDYLFSVNDADKYTYDKYVATDNDMFALKTTYTYASTEQAIDSGKMCGVAIDYTGIQVESVVLSDG